MFVLTTVTTHHYGLDICKGGAAANDPDGSTDGQRIDQLTASHHVLFGRKNSDLHELLGEVVHPRRCIYREGRGAHRVETNEPIVSTARKSEPIISTAIILIRLSHARRNGGVVTAKGVHKKGLPQGTVIFPLRLQITKDAAREEGRVAEDKRGNFFDFLFLPEFDEHFLSLVARHTDEPGNDLEEDRRDDEKAKQRFDK
mmetsp:Transcript_38874/g.105478  ORF Transcript_38874/g.105478 Transcript_38874/m.105478 type:complete len:200 (-) Transcript_38874:261-860(-)